MVVIYLTVLPWLVGKRVKGALEFERTVFEHNADGRKTRWLHDSWASLNACLKLFMSDWEASVTLIEWFDTTRCEQTKLVIAKMAPVLSQTGR